jgi:hypothetical protein
MKNETIETNKQTDDVSDFAPRDQAILPEMDSDFDWECHDVPIEPILIGERVIGVFRGIESHIKTKDGINSKAGDAFQYIIMENAKREKTGYWYWAGLEQAFKKNIVEPGMLLMIERIKDAELDDGRKCNQYKIYFPRKKETA